MSTLLIHCRKGLYQITKCLDCGYIFECENCDANLVTYRSMQNRLELICHHCQSFYNYPKECPKCNSRNLDSKVSGIDDLAEKINQEFKTQVIRIDKNEKFDSQKSPIAVTTRIFDPSIDYSIFDKIIFIQAQNLLASPDYLVLEESVKSLSEVMLKVNSENTEIIFDTNSPQIQFFQEIIKINMDHPNPINVHEWFFDFLKKEKENRQIFKFPPFWNLILLTTQEKKKENSYQIQETVKERLEKEKNCFSEITISPPYPARILRRKNLYSHHLLVRYPRQYAKFKLLRHTIMEIAENYNLQVRLNPRHLF